MQPHVRTHNGGLGDNDVYDTVPVWILNHPGVSSRALLAWAYLMRHHQAGKTR